MAAEYKISESGYTIDVYKRSFRFVGPGDNITSFIFTKQTITKSEARRYLKSMVAFTQNVIIDLVDNFAQLNSERDQLLDEIEDLKYDNMVLAHKVDQLITWRG